LAWLCHLRRVGGAARVVGPDCAGGRARLGALVSDLHPGRFDVDAAVVLLFTTGTGDSIGLADEPDTGDRRLQRIGRASALPELLPARRHTVLGQPGLWLRATCAS